VCVCEIASDKQNDCIQAPLTGCVTVPPHNHVLADSTTEDWNDGKNILYYYMYMY